MQPAVRAEVVRVHRNGEQQAQAAGHHGPHPMRPPTRLPAVSAAEGVKSRPFVTDLLAG